MTNKPTAADYIAAVNSVTQGAGRGKKKCPTCSSFVGVRTHLCSCGYEFVKGSSKQKVDFYNDKPDDIDLVFSRKMYSGNTGPIIFTPSDECPIKYKNMDVVEWLENMLCEGRSQNKAYSPSALKYYLRNEVKKYTKTLDKKVDKWVKSYMEN